MSYITFYFRNIIIFLIFMNFIEIILPNKKYKNYMDFVLGLVLISIIVTPIVNLMNIKPNISFQDTTKNAEQNIYTNETDYTKVLYENQLSTQFSTFLDTENIAYSDIKILTDENYIVNDISFNIIDDGSKDLSVESSYTKNLKNEISNEYNVSLDNIHINITN